MNRTAINKEVCIDKEPYVGMIFELNEVKNVYGAIYVVVIYYKYSNFECDNH